MIRLFRSIVAAVLLAAAAITAQQTRPTGQVPPQNPLSQTGVANLSSAADALMDARLRNPRLVWPGLAAGSDPKSVSPFAPQIHALIAAANSTDRSVRQAFLVAAGRLGLPGDLAKYVIPSLGDVDARVRREAANAIAMVLHDKKADGAGEATDLAVKALIERAPLEGDGATAGLMLSVLGEIANEATGKSAERLLRQESRFKVPTPVDFDTRQDGALRGFEALTRHFPGFGLDDETRVLLRKLAAPGFGFEKETGPMLPAVESLVHIRDGDLATIRTIAMFRCDQSFRTRSLPVSHRPDCGWEYRRLGFQLMDGPRREYLAALKAGLADFSFRVRIEALRVYARDIPKSRTCAALFDGLLDREPIVVIETIRLLDVKCDGEKEYIADRLRTLAMDLGDDDKAIAWHVPSAAMEGLVRFAPVDAARIANEIAALHKTWNVRAAAARVAGATADEALAMRLFTDDEPNVRTEVLYALIRMQSGKLADASAEALESNDYQLVLTAASALYKVGNGADWLPAVLRALQRLTKTGDSTSREARLALLARVQQANNADKDVIDRLKPLLEDFDPTVAWAASDVLSALTGETFDVKPHGGPLPAGQGGGCFEVDLANGQFFTIHLRGRIESLAKDSFYDGLTFHRAIPDAFVEGGSPAGNYYTGADRRKEPSFGPEEFLLDVLTAEHHARGTVSLSRHDPNTGSRQFFIELVDSPHLDRDFTVIGQVGGCYFSDPSPDVLMDVVDHIMEGAKILHIQYRPPPYS